MSWIEVIIEHSAADPAVVEQLVVCLYSANCAGIREETSWIRAYFPAEGFSRKELEDRISGLRAKPAGFTITCRHLPEVNWNAEWESYYEPVAIERLCYIRAPFHDRPEDAYPYELVINPGMAFGTGHHETTRLIIKELGRIDVKDRRVLDAGCGSGILAILSRMMGAADVLAIDADPVAVRSAAENISLNQADRITVQHRDLHDLENQDFDILIANINLNVLVDNIGILSSLSSDNNAVLLLSGFYQKDIPAMSKAMAAVSLRMHHKRSLNEWTVMRCIRT